MTCQREARRKGNNLEQIKQSRARDMAWDMLIGAGTGEAEWKVCELEPKQEKEHRMDAATNCQASKHGWRIHLQTKNDKNRHRFCT